MDINPAASNRALAAAYEAAMAAVHAIETVDVSREDDEAAELMRDRALDLGFELQIRGLRECGVCPKPKPYAVDWGHSCDKTPEEIQRDAADFARIHD